MEKYNPYTEAESCRNSLLMTLYGLETYVAKAKNTKDFIDLIRRTGMLAESMARVLEKLAETGESLKEIDAKTSAWIKSSSGK